MAIEIPKYETKCVIETGEEKLCVGIQSIKFKVDYFKIEWAETMEDIPEQKFFYEPAD